MFNNTESYVIHMSSATEREEIVQKLEDFFQAKRMEAVKGDLVLEKYKSCKHPLFGQKVLIGAIGCIESHIAILKQAKLGKPYLGIFEDDCEINVSVSEIEHFLSENIPDDWDIICLGTTESVKPYSSVNSEVDKIGRFWGTHAMIVKKEIIPKLLFTYNRLMKEKIFPVADWFYAFAIQEHKLNVYAPHKSKAFVCQKEGLVSSITGGIRK